MADRYLTTRRTVVLAAAGIWLIAATYGLARFAYGLFVPAFRADFSLDGATAGLIASLSYLAYCGGIVVATVLSPRIGARLTAALAGVLATVGTAVIAAATDAGTLALGVALAGSSTGVASPPLAQAIGRSVKPARRDRVQTVVNAGTGLGVVVSGPVALLVQDDWRWAWAAFAVLSAVAAIAATISVPTARAERSAGPPRRRRPAGAGALTVAAAVMGVATAAVWTFGQDLLQAAGGQAPDTSTWAWIVLGACGLLGAGAGDLVSRWGLGPSWRMLLLVAAATTAALAAWPGSPVVAIGASGAFGAVYIGLTGILLIWSTRVFEERPSTGVGVAFLALAVGQALGAPLLGALADVADLRLAFVAAALVTLAACAVRPPRGTEAT